MIQDDLPPTPDWLNNTPPLDDLPPAPPQDPRNAAETPPLDDLPEPPPAPPEFDPEKKADPVLRLVASATGLDGDGQANALVRAHVFGEDGAELADAVVTFSLGDIASENAATLTPVPPQAARLLARARLSGEDVSVVVRADTTVIQDGLPSPLSAELRIDVRAANPNLVITGLPAQQPFATGRGSFAIGTEFTLFQRPVSDYRITFGSDVAGRIAAGDGVGTTLAVPLRAFQDETVNLRTDGTYVAGDLTIDLSRRQSVTFKALSPQMTLRSLKAEIDGDGADSATFDLSGRYANGETFLPDDLTVTSSIGSCSRAGGTISLVAMLTAAQDQVATVVASGSVPDHDGPTRVSASTTIRIKSAAPRLILTAPAEILANGFEQALLQAEVSFGGKLTPASEIAWEIAPANIGGSLVTLGAIEGTGSVVNYRVPMLVRTPVMEQCLRARCAAHGTVLHGEVSVRLHGLDPRLELSFPPDTSHVRANGKPVRLTTRAWYGAYDSEWKIASWGIKTYQTGYMPRDLAYEVAESGPGEVSTDGSEYTPPKRGNRHYDDKTVKIRVTGRIVGDDAPAPGHELIGVAECVLRSPNPECQISIAPGVIAPGGAFAALSLNPMLYGRDARELGGELRYPTLTPSDGGIVVSVTDIPGGLAQARALAAGTSSGTTIQASVPVELEGQFYECKGSVGLFVERSGKASFELVYAIEPRPGPSGGLDGGQYVDVKARLVGAAPGTTLIIQSFVASLAFSQQAGGDEPATQRVPDLEVETIDSTSFRIPLGLFLCRAGLTVKATATTQPGDGTVLDCTLDIPLVGAVLRIKRRPDFDLYRRDSRWGDDWDGSIETSLSGWRGPKAYPIADRDITLQIDIEEVDSTDRNPVGSPQLLHDYGNCRTSSGGIVQETLTFEMLRDVISSWTKRPHRIALHVVASAVDDYGNTATHRFRLAMKRPDALEMRIPDRPVMEHLDPHSEINTPAVAVLGDGRASDQFTWTLIARAESNKVQILNPRQRVQRGTRRKAVGPMDPGIVKLAARLRLDFPDPGRPKSPLSVDLDAGVASVLDLSVENFELRQDLHNLPLEFRWPEQPEDGRELSADDVFDRKRLSLWPLVERLDGEKVAATSSPELSFWRIFWPNDPFGKDLPDISGEVSYHFRNPVIFVHGIIGSELRRGGETIWPTVEMRDRFSEVGSLVTPPEVRAPVEVALTPGAWEPLLKELIPPVILRFMPGIMTGTQRGLPMGKEFETRPAKELDSISSDGVHATSPIRYVPPDHECYLGWLQFYEDQGYAVRDMAVNRDIPPVVSSSLGVMSYDWRLDNRHHAERLSLFVNTMLERYYGPIQCRTRPQDRRVVIMAHSMGGLVSRYYAATLAREYEKNIEMLITVGTPHRGAPDPMLAAVGGQQNPGGVMDKLLNLFPATTIEMCDRIPSNVELHAFKRKCFYVETIYGDKSDPLNFWEVEDELVKMYRKFYGQVLEQAREHLAMRRRDGGLGLPDDPADLVSIKPDDLQGFWKVPRIAERSREFQQEIKEPAPPRTIQFAGTNRRSTEAVSLVLDVQIHTWTLEDLRRKLRRPPAIEQNPLTGERVADTRVSYFETALRFSWTATDERKGRKESDPQGDGTVPFWGAEIDGCLRFYKVALADRIHGSDLVHRSMGSDPTIQRAWRSILGGVLPPAGEL